jgi:transposase
LHFDCILKKAELQQHELELVSIDALVPSGHPLRKVDQMVGFRFIRERAKHLYSEHDGRPALDPVVLFKLLYGVRSEQRLMREVEVRTCASRPMVPAPR